MKRTIDYRGDIMTYTEFLDIVIDIYKKYYPPASNWNAADFEDIWLDYEPISMLEFAQDAYFQMDRNRFLLRLNSTDEMIEVATGKREGPTFTSLSGQTSNYIPDTYISLEHVCGIITSTYPSTTGTSYTKHFNTKAKI
jgi:hypothetical protein